MGRGESWWPENPSPFVTACLSQRPPLGQGDATVWSPHCHFPQVSHGVEGHTLALPLPFPGSGHFSQVLSGQGLRTGWDQPGSLQGPGRQEPADFLGFNLGSFTASKRSGSSQLPTLCNLKSLSPLLTSVPFVREGVRLGACPARPFGLVPTSAPLPAPLAPEPW